MVQANGRSPVCTRRCLAKCDARVNASVHKSQGNGLYCDFVLDIIFLRSFTTSFVLTVLFTESRTTLGSTLMIG